jgi:hypothetical protein
MIQENRCYPLFTGFRGSILPLDPLVQLLEKVSGLVLANPCIVELEKLARKIAGARRSG